MKKLITILLSATALIANADDTAELIALVEQVQEVKETSANVALATNLKQANEQIETLETANQYISQRLFQLELQPKFMASRLAYRNTFIWYIWNDYDKANGFEKLGIGEQIFNLTK